MICHATTLILILGDICPSAGEYQYSNLQQRDSKNDPKSSSVRHRSLNNSKYTDALNYKRQQEDYPGFENPTNEYQLKNQKANEIKNMVREGYYQGKFDKVKKLLQK